VHRAHLRTDRERPGTGALDGGGVVACRWSSMHQRALAALLVLSKRQSKRSRLRVAQPVAEVVVIGRCRDAVLRHGKSEQEARTTVSPPAVVTVAAGATKLTRLSVLEGATRCLMPNSMTTSLAAFTVTVLTSYANDASPSAMAVLCLVSSRCGDRSCYFSVVAQNAT